MQWSSYFFNTNPGGDFLLGYVLAVLFALFIWLPSSIKKRSQNNKYLRKSVRRRLWRLLVIGGGGMILVLSRFGEVPGLSMRLWLYLWLVVGGLIFLWTIWQVRRDYTERIASVAREKSKKQ